MHIKRNTIGDVQGCLGQKNATEKSYKRRCFPTPIPTPTAIFYGFFRHEKFTESSPKRNCKNGLDVYDGLKSTSRNSNLSFSAKKRTRPVRVGFSFCRGWSVWYPVKRDTPNSIDQKAEAQQPLLFLFLLYHGISSPCGGSVWRRWRLRYSVGESPPLKR